MIGAVIGALIVGATLGLLGSGGSILTVPILRYLLHHEPKVAIAESLLIVGVVSCAGFAHSLRAGRADWRCVLSFGVPGMLGGLTGALVAKWIPGHVQLILLAVIMLGAAYRMFQKPTPGLDHSAPNRSLTAMAAMGAAVGCVTGLVGVGGGFLIVPALVVYGGLPMGMAVGTSLGVIALNCAISFSTYLITVRDLNWPIVGLFALVGIAGMVVGQSVGARLPQQKLRRIFAIFLVLVAVWALWKELSDLG